MESQIDVGNCIFCNIIKNDDHENIVHKDEDFVAVPDIHPVAKHHFLVISRKHIPSAKHLTSKDRLFLENMAKVARMVLEGAKADMSDSLFGFHWPPFISVRHLHLHAISPASQLGFFHKYIAFKPDSWFFTSPEYVLNRIGQSDESEGEANCESSK